MTTRHGPSSCPGHVLLPGRGLEWPQQQLLDILVQWLWAGVKKIMGSPVIRR